MKLHHLRLIGIGPFAGTVEIDLAALGASGMFLLEGPTGSGKSTILDAIVYALYGQVAGDTSPARIRSHFAPPQQASVVDLVFETGSGIYRVRRSPEYQRPKLRGSGTTKEQAKAVLWRISSPQALPEVIADVAGGGGGVDVVATRIDEVAREIERAIGLTREQFTQTVLLPQNEFARFLRADTKDRQQVLQRLFGTEIYAAVEKELEEQRRQAKRDVDAARQTLATALARFTEAAAVEDEPAAQLADHADALRLDTLAEGADGILTAATAQEAEAVTAAQTARAAEKTAREAADAARAARTRIQRRRDLDELAARLEREAPAAVAATAALQADETARPVVDLLRRRDRAATQATRAAEALTDAMTAARAAHPHLVGLLEQPEAAAQLATAAEEATAAAGALAELAELETALPAREQKLTARREALATAQQALADLTDQLAARPAQRTDLLAQQEQAREQAGQLPSAQHALQEAQQTQQNLSALAAQETATATARDTAAATLETARELAETEADLRRRRFAGIAAELAGGLEPQQPCPVCGGTEHPSPAEPGPDAVSPEQVEAAEQQRRRAETAQAAAQQDLALAEQKTADLRERTASITAEDAAAAVTAAQQQVTAATTARQRTAELEQQLTAHDEETARLSATRERDALAVEREDTAITATQDALTADRARITEARGEDATITARRTAHTATARTATVLREALREREDAMERAAELEQETAAALATSGLVTAEAARAAALADTERTRLRQQTQARAVDEQRLADGLAEDGIADTDASDTAAEQAEHAVHAAAAALEQASARAREAGAVSARRTARAERTRAARTLLTEATAQVRRVSEEAGVIVRVADLATGRSADGDRVQLSTYVLMWRLDAVIDAANERLALFSGSELELMRDTGARGARRTGLDLLILDRRTDCTRVPETLSGGETFFVSLALALGLADIVMGEAGGVQMETLFIDEGFGSLDPETLETVVREIGRLAQSGRTIGVVSHVGDMKSQIAEQIHVRRGEDDRSTVTITA
ncbi:SMC family ATPase [Brachybacterium sp. Marseille-Q7125]|uniref:AAA family ATPase n=1 Tax=Brachybacterium sp. Marseille-Q7125 TaxID=2932815 RepID=UPI001FF5C5FE|nr:SMC family ATPase [Brachybacterium sp. Marseille-Q7125]